MTSTIRHTGIVVNDLDNSITFWCEIMGFNIQRKMLESGEKIDSMMGLKNVKVTTAKLSDKNGNLIELLKFESHPDLKEWQGKPYSTGISHLALTVDNFDETIKKLDKFDIKLKNKPIISNDKKVKVVYITCLEGLLLEIVENRS